MFSKFNKLGVNLSGSVGKTNNFLANTNGIESQQHSLSLHYNALKNIFIKLGADYTKTNVFKRDASLGNYLNSNIGVQYNSHKNGHFSLHYVSGYSLAFQAPQRDFFTATTQWYLGTHHSVSASLNYYEHFLTNGNKSYRVQMKYTYSGGIGVKKTFWKGSVKGQVKVDNYEGSLAGIIVTMDQFKTITDTKGRFHFPQVKEGDYLLSVLKQSIPEGLILMHSNDLAISVNKEKKSGFQIHLQPSGWFMGALFIHEDQGKSVINAKVALSNESGTFLVPVDKRGRFSARLMAGTYALSIPKIRENRKLLNGHLDKKKITILPSTKTQSTLIYTPNKRKITIVKNEFNLL